MRRHVALMVLGLAVTGAVAAETGPQAVFDLHHGRKMPLAEIAPQLIRNRIVLVGEHHDEEGHHRAQLNVIQALVEAGGRVVVGLEMFRRDSQEPLDRWVRGEIGPQDFEKIYAENWSYPWAMYRPIFDYAREKRLPMIGLNVPRAITRQVARSGFASLSDEQRGQLSDVTCRIDAEYMRYIRSVFGAHAHGGMDFTFFCEAQMVWDTAMAVHALNHLESNPGATVVILAGVGHARKEAVPRQVRLRAQVPVTVFLPEVAGSIDPRTVDRDDADYLLLDLK
jgi:uncharacterized iron-regulated protein